MALTNHIVPDSPTNNFATMNPLAYRNGYNSIQYSEGNLRVVQGTSAISYANFTTKSGKWYWEIFIEDNGSVASSDYRGLAEPVSGQSSDGWGNDCFLYNSYNGTYRLNTGSFTASDIGTANNPNIIGFFWDADNGYMTVSVNGVSGTTITGLSTGIPMCPAVNCNYDTIDIINFGQDPTFGGAKSPTTTYTDANGIGSFYYDPTQIASDVKALCTANLPDFTPDVADDTPQDYFKAVIWTNATTDTNVTVNLPFQADMIWWKQRDQGNSHRLIDSVRGLTSELTTNSTTQESIIDPATRDYNVTSINSDNFTFNGYVNTSTRGGSMVAWCWKAGGAPSGSTSTTGSAKRINTSGTQDDTSCSALATAATNAGASNVITPTLMSINQAAGFSIVKYTGNGSSGATVPHGLNDPIEFLLCKQLSDTSTWVGYAWNSWHRFLSDDYYIPLNTNAGQNNDAFIWDTSGMTNKVFTHGNVPAVMNRSTGDYIAYCWHSVENYSKFGSYTGNGSADGPMVYCGFRPAFVICKCSSDTTTTHTSWAMYDNARDSSNVMNKVLYANKSINEGYRGDASTAATDIYIDFLSNGFKVRSTKEEVNDDGETYIYAAFAEQPFKYSNAR